MPLRQIQAIDETNELYSNFINSIESRFTRRAFSGYLRRYMEYHTFTAYEQLISERKIVQSQVIDFINAQKSKGLTADSIGNYLTAVKHFYVYNDVTDINWLKVKKFLGERTKTVNDRAYTKEEIAQILSKCDERKRVIVLLLASTGMRIGAIPGLSIGSLHRIEAANLYRITVYERTKDQYFAFCTPECAIAIDDYLEYRKRYGEVLKPAAPLIREQFDKKDSFAVQHPRRNSNFTIEKLLRDAAVDAGIRTIAKGKENIHKRKDIMLAHGFRKYFNTSLIAGGVKPVVKELLMGHSVGLEDSYYRPTEEQMLNEYLKAIDALTMSEEKQLKNEVAKLKTEVSDIELMKKSYLELTLQAEQKEMIQTDALTQMADTIGKLQKEIELLKKK